jgi:hypothetical protein
MGSSAFELAVTTPFAGSVAFPTLMTTWLATRTGTVKSRTSAGGWETWRSEEKKRLQWGKGEDVSIIAERMLLAGEEQKGENEANGGMAIWEQQQR